MCTVVMIMQTDAGQSECHTTADEENRCAKTVGVCCVQIWKKENGTDEVKCTTQATEHIDEQHGKMAEKIDPMKLSIDNVRTSRTIDFPSLRDENEC